MKFLDKIVMWLAGIAAAAGFLLALPAFLLARVCHNRRFMRWVPLLALVCFVFFQGYMENELSWWTCKGNIDHLKFYRYSSPGSWWFRRDELWCHVMERQNYSRKELVVFFLKHGASPDEGLYRFFFEISDSFQSREDENMVLQMLLAAGAKPDVLISGNRPLEHAVIKKKFDLAKILLKSGATIRSWADDSGRSVLHLAAFGGAEAEVLDGLATAIGPSAWTVSDRSGRVPIHYLSTPEQLELFASATEILARPSRTGANLLHYSIQARKPKVFDRLLEMGFTPETPDASGCPPLAYAANFATFSRLKELMPPAYSLSTQCRQRLWLNALQSGSEDFILAIIAEGVDLQARLKNGNLPIHEILQFRKAPRLIQVLASAGADIQALDLKQNTPLHQAIEHRNASAAEILLDLGANARVLNANRQTPLSLANQALQAVKRMPRNLSLNGLREEMEACRPWEKLILRLEKMSQVAEVELPCDATLPALAGGTSGSGASVYGSGGESSSEREKLCPTCGGSGNCQSCYGGGEVTDFATLKRVKCRQCRGTGRCQTCGGKGRIR